MTRRDNHYQLLGVDPSAPAPTIQSALERLADQANRLAYTSPQHSHELWNQVRQVREDLLSGSARRQAYDASLLESRSAAVAARERPQSAPAAVPGSAPCEPVPPPAAPTAHPVRSSTRGISLWPLVAAGAVVAVTLLLAFALHRPGPGPDRGVARRATRPPSGLTTTGFRNSVGFVSGKRVTFHWRAMPHAVLYHLQVTTATDPGFRSPSLSTLTLGTVGSVKLPGRRRYLWRVQALIGGNWSPYSRAADFLVARPRTSAPRLYGPAPRSVKHGRVRLCWSPVPWAIAYLLRVKPSPGDIRVHGTCHTVTEKPGTYTWTVAGLILGVQTYPGPYANPQRFTVPARR